MYKDLSLKEKAKVIREGVRLGLNSIDDILSLYDEAISLQGSPIVTPYGQWKYPGRDTIIPSNNITMDNVNYPVLGISDAGDTKVMMPWNDYKFRGSVVYEHPLIGNLALEGKKFNRQRISDNEYFSIMERVAEENNSKWNEDRKKRNQRQLSVDEELLRLLNSNDYDYRGYYTKYPNSKANADTHWTDEFKTVYHPTFSEESIYSGIIDRNYNPYGYIGGSWGNNDEFIPATWLLDNRFQLGGLAKPFSYGDIPDVRYLKGGHLYQSKGFIDFKSPEEILTEKYSIEPVIADNTNIILNPVYTPQEKSYAAALLAFYERHSSPKAEQRALQQAYDAVMEQNAAEFGTIGTPLSNNLQYSWRRFKNAKGSELLYPVAPSLMFGIDIADKLKEGDYVGAGEDLLSDAAFTYAPEIGGAIKNKLNSGINLLKQSNFRFRVPYKNQNYYRVVYGDKAIYDAIQSGLIRGSETYPEGAYFYKGKPYYATSSKDIRIIEGDPNVINFVEPNLFRYLDEDILKGINSGKLNAGDYVFRPYETGNYQNGVEILPIDNSKLHYEALPFYNGKTHVPSNLFNYWKRNPLIGWRKYNFSKGGSIHIKLENRGKFTALKKRTGHSASWFKAHGTPALKKMATFELNSRHWNKYALGGYLEGGIYDLPDEEVKRLINLGYEIEYL